MLDIGSFNNKYTKVPTGAIPNEGVMVCPIPSVYICVEVFFDNSKLASLKKDCVHGIQAIKHNLLAPTLGPPLPSVYIICFLLRKLCQRSACRVI